MPCETNAAVLTFPSEIDCEDLSEECAIPKLPKNGRWAGGVSACMEPLLVGAQCKMECMLGRERGAVDKESFLILSKRFFPTVSTT